MERPSILTTIREHIFSRLAGVHLPLLWEPDSLEFIPFTVANKSESDESENEFLGLPLTSLGSSLSSFLGPPLVPPLGHPVGPPEGLPLVNPFENMFGNPLINPFEEENNISNLSEFDEGMYALSNVF